MIYSIISLCCLLPKASLVVEIRGASESRVIPPCVCDSGFALSPTLDKGFTVIPMSSPLELSPALVAKLFEDRRK